MSKAEPSPSELLSPRELEIVHLAYLQNQEVAERLMISTETVKTHWRLIRSKLGVRSKSQALHVVLTGKLPAPHVTGPTRMVLICPRCQKEIADFTVKE